MKFVLALVAMFNFAASEYLSHSHANAGSHQAKHYAHEYSPEHIALIATDANNTEEANGYSKPKDNECLLWPDGNFNGTPESITLDTSKCKGGPYTYEAGSEVNYYFIESFNDKLDSWACGKEVAFDFCNDRRADSCRNCNGVTGVGPSKQNKVGWANY